MAKLSLRNTGEIQAADYGVIADGSTDNTARMQEALDAAASYGCALRLSKGTTLCTGAGLSLGAVPLRGWGPGISTLKLTGAGGLTTTDTVRPALEHMTLWATAAPYALGIKCTASNWQQHFRARNCQIRSDAAASAAVYLESNTGTGGLGFVYWPTFLDCDLMGPGGAGSAVVRSAATGNGILFFRMWGGRSTRAQRHFDMVNFLSARVRDVEFDDNATTGATGRFLYFGSGANGNQFMGCHFESSGMDKAVEFTAGAEENLVENDGAALDFSAIEGHTNGATLGVGNGTLGFTQVTSQDANVMSFPATFPLLLQDTISERTAGAGVTIDGLKLKDGRVVGGGFNRPDDTGYAIYVGNGEVVTFGVLGKAPSAGGRYFGWESTNRLAISTSGVQTIGLYSVPSNSNVTLHISIVGRRTGGAAAGNVGDGIYFNRLVRVKNVAGVVTIEGTPDVVGTDQVGAYGASCSFAVSGTDLQIRADVGTANVNLTWDVAWNATPVNA